MVRRTRTTRLGAALFAALAFAGCDADRPGAVEPLPRNEAGIEPVPHPELAEFESAVRAALERGRAQLEAAQQQGRSASLARAYGELGMLYQAHHLPAAAAVCYENASRLEPADYRWHYYLAYLHADGGDLDLAIEGYERMLALDPQFLPAKLRLAQAYMDDQQFALARQTFERALSQHEHAAARAGLGKLAYQAGDHRAAVSHLQRALQLQPGASRLHYPLGLAYRELGDLERARAHLDRGLQGGGEPDIDDPLLAALANLSRSAQFYLARGQQQIERRQYREAAESFRQALAHNPADPAAHATLGRVLQTLGAFEDALAEYDLALALSPGHPQANYFKGALLEAAGQEAPALEHYAAAVRGNPDYLEPRYLLATGLMRADRFAEAAAEYAQLARRKPESVDLHHWEGLAWLAAGDCARALAALERGHRQMPSYGGVIQALARAYASCPAATPAQRARGLELGEMLYAARADPETATTQAMALAANGRYEEAAALQRQVLDQLDEGEDRDFARECLRRYLAGQTASRAWPPASPALDPPRPEPVR